MRLAVVQRVLGLFLLLFSGTLLIPLALSIFYQDGETRHFAVSLGAIFTAGFLLWLPVAGRRGSLRTREAFVIVTLFWVALGLLGSLPLILGAHLNITDAAFEAVSAFTTTGATVIVGLDHLPPSLLIYRQQLQWFGGMGVVVLAVAILPMLGVGGMQLYRAETPGPMKDEKITPRINQTARGLWGIYLGLTALCGLAYWLAGMTPFDAIAHSLATVATGGFSTHDASLAYFNSPLIEAIATVFMLLGGINFAVHFRALAARDPGHYWRDTEVRTFLSVVVLLSLAIGLTLYQQKTYPNILEALRYSAFQVASVITTTGFGTATFADWPLFIPVLLMLSTFMAGCAGSTSGGMKTIRFIILAKQGKRDIDRLVHPNLVRPLKLHGRAIPDRVIDAVWGFFSAYVAVFAILMVSVMATGLDQVTAFGAVATCLNNVGPGLGEVSANFVNINATAKWLLTFAMLLGRLELFTLLVLFLPSFWRK